MEANSYEVTDSVAGFTEGDVLDVTARFGDWHTHDLKLELKSTRGGHRTVLVSETTGFTEREILDPTARFGDWHEYDLAFEPGSATDDPQGFETIRLTMDELTTIAEPVEAAG